MVFDEPTDADAEGSKPKPSPDEQIGRSRKAIDLLVEAGEIDPAEAEEQFEVTVAGAATANHPRDQKSRSRG